MRPLQELKAEAAEIRAIYDEMARKNDLHEFLEILADQAMSLLEEAGLPNRPDVRHECRQNGDWRALGEAERWRDRAPTDGPRIWTTSLRDAVRYLGFEIYSYEDYLAWGLDVIHNVRRDLANVDFERACRRCLELGHIVTECRLVTEKGAIFEHGMRFRSDGPKAPRCDALNRLIDEAFDNLGLTATAAQVLEYVRADKKTVQEVGEDEYEIYWQDARGRDQMTSFKSFQNRVSNRRKKLQEQ